METPSIRIRARKGIRMESLTDHLVLVVSWVLECDELLKLFEWFEALHIRRSGDVYIRTWSCIWTVSAIPLREPIAFRAGLRAYALALELFGCMPVNFSILRRVCESVRCNVWWEVFQKQPRLCLVGDQFRRVLDQFFLKEDTEKSQKSQNDR